MLVENFMSGVSEPDDTFQEDNVNIEDDIAMSSVSGAAVGSPRRRKVAATATSQGSVITPASTVNDDVAVEQSH